MENSLADVVERGRALLDLAGKGLPERETLPAYKDNETRRDFAEDIIARVATISFAFERLHELTQAFNELWRAVEEKRSLAGNPVPISRDIRERELRLEVEADAMTGLIYYEVSSVAQMLAAFRVQVPRGSELEYLVKARDRFLVHSKLQGLMRRPNRGGSIPVGEGFLRRDAVSLNTLDYDRAAVDGLLESMKGKDWSAERKRNEEIVRSGTWNERLSPEEVTRVMAFGVRDADVERALGELARLLTAQMLPIIEAITKEAIEKFGFEHYPEGDWLSYRYEAFTGG